MHALSFSLSRSIVHEEATLFLTNSPFVEAALQDITSQNPGESAAAGIVRKALVVVEHII